MFSVYHIRKWKTFAVAWNILSLLENLYIILTFLKKNQKQVLGKTRAETNIQMVRNLLGYAGILIPRKYSDT